MLNFFHIARNCFRECLREPIFFLLLVSAIGLIGLFPTLSMFVFREQIKLVVDSSMATTLVFGLVAAVLSASHTISREMKNGTVLLLLSKPVNRWIFIIAKIAGITLALTLFVFLCNIATLISLRVAKDQFQLDFLALYIYYLVLLVAGIVGAARNYFTQQSFSATTIYALLVIFPLFIFILYFIPIDGKIGRLNLEVIPALILVMFAVWIMGTITVVLATRLEMVANLLLAAVIFFLGLISNYCLAGPGKENFFALLYSFLPKWLSLIIAPFTNFLASILYIILPNWQFFWMADALASNTKIPLTYMICSFIYVIFYMTFCSLIAIAMFQDREVAVNIR